MDTAEFAPSTIRANGAQLSVAHGTDGALITVFYFESVRQGAESDKAGRNIYKDVPYIWIRFAGDKTREIKRPVRKGMGPNGELPDAERFPAQWRAFELQGAEVHEGTPLEQWPQISRSTALNLKGANIFTVENLAAVPDSVLHNLGTGAREMRDKAIAWLKSAQDSSVLMNAQAENQKLRDDIEMLKAQMLELGKGKKRKGEED